VLKVRRAQITVGSVLLMLVSALLAIPALAETKTKTTSKAATITVTAQTTKRALRQGAVRIGKVSWNCRDNRCTTRGTSSLISAETCRDLARQVGTIRSYGYSGKRLTAQELERCNAGAVAAKTKTKTSPTTKGTGKTGPTTPSTARGSTTFRVPGTLTMTGTGTTGTVFSVPGTLTMTGMGTSGNVFSVPGTLAMTGMAVEGTTFVVPGTLTMTGQRVEGNVFTVPGTLTMTGVNR
jgi:hypothetical protein